MVNKSKNKISYLSERQQDYLEQRKTLKEIQRQNLEYQRQKQLEKSESTYGRIKSGISSTGRTLFKPVKRISQPTSFQVGQQLNAEQGFLSELFGGGDKVLFNSPNSQSLPQLNGSLMPNRFNEFEDMEENSADVFGLRKDGRTGGLFGI
jgi:hypothetical protein